MHSSSSCHTMYRKDSKFLKLISEKTFDVNEIKFGGVEKMTLSIPLQKFQPVAPNLDNIVFGDVIRNYSTLQMTSKLAKTC